MQSVRVRDQVHTQLPQDLWAGALPCAAHPAAAGDRLGAGLLRPLPRPLPRRLLRALHGTELLGGVLLHRSADLRGHAVGRGDAGRSLLRLQCDLDLHGRALRRLWQGARALALAALRGAGDAGRVLRLHAHQPLRELRLGLRSAGDAGAGRARAALSSAEGLPAALCDDGPLCLRLDGLLLLGGLRLR